MTLTYIGVMPKSQIVPSAKRIIYEILPKKTRRRNVKMVEVVRVEDTTIKITKSNIKDFDRFFNSDML